MLTPTDSSWSRCLQLVLVQLLLYGLTFSTAVEVAPDERTSDNAIITGHKSNNDEPNILQLLDDLDEAPLLLKLIDKVGLRDLLTSKGKVKMNVNLCCRGVARLFKMRGGKGGGPQGP